MRSKIFLSLLIVAFVMCGCKKDNSEKAPSFLHLDKVTLVERTDASVVSPEGFLSCDIDAVQLLAYWDGDDEETNLGVYQLPCTVPALRKDTITRLIIVPVIKQNGIAATRVEYPYYEYVYLYNVPIATDSTTNIGTPDADGLWTVSTTYRPWTVQQIVNGQVLSVSDTVVKVLAQEYFDDIQYSLIFDSKVHRTTEASEIRSGTGSGYVVVADSASTVDFEINSDIICNDPNAYLYLEMDYKTDVRLSVGMKSAYYDGGNTSIQSAMTLYETDKWKKIYINMGRLWTQFNRNSKFRIVFSALNSEGKGGFVYLDNVKLVQM